MFIDWAYYWERFVNWASDTKDLLITIGIAIICIGVVSTTFGDPQTNFWIRTIDHSKIQKLNQIQYEVLQFKQHSSKTNEVNAITVGNLKQQVNVNKEEIKNLQDQLDQAKKGVF